jgi:hypothetical protein
MAEDDGYKIVNIGEGRTARFPESMSWEAVQENLAKQFPAKNQPQNQALSESPQSGGMFDNAWKQYQNFINPKREVIPKNSVATHIFGTPTDFTKEELIDGALKVAGYGTMLFAPEIRAGALLPGAVRAALPRLTGPLKVGKDILSSVLKTGAAGYGGTKILPGTNEEQAQTAGVIGGGTAAAATPFAMLLASQNPMVRFLAGGGLGALGGYGASHVTGHTPYAMGLGAGAGALLGARGGAVSEVAAQNMNRVLTPEQLALAEQRQAAAGRQGIQLTPAEQTGNPVLAGMQNNAAMSAPGSQILYPAGMQRQNQVENSYNRLLQGISPEYPNAGNVDLPFSTRNTMESAAFERAGDVANQRGTRVAVQPVIDYINEQLPLHEAGSSIAKALREARQRLNPTPQTRAAQERLLEPATRIDSHLRRQSQQLQHQIAQMEEQVPDPYFRASSGYDQRLNALRQQLMHNERIQEQFTQSANANMSANHIGDYENTVQGLHNAKMGINGMIEGKGDKAIDNAAKGVLRQISRRLTAQIKNASPEYEAATLMSNYRQARQSIEEAMGKSGITGSNIYNNVLAHPANYQELYRRLADPRHPNRTTFMQQSLADLRTALPDLMENLTAKSGQALSKEGAEINVSIPGLTKSLMNKLYMDRYNRAIAELIVNPRWRERLADVARMRQGEDRGIRLSRLISEVAVAGSSGPMQQQSQGSDDNGTQP